MKKYQKNMYLLMVAAAMLMGLAACQKQMALDEAIVNPVSNELKASSYEEFHAMLAANPNLVIKTYGDYFNEPDSDMTEQEFLSRVRLVSIPGFNDAYTAPAGATGSTGARDVVLPITYVTAHPTWPEPCYLNYVCSRNFMIAFPSYNYYILRGFSPALAIYYNKVVDPLSSINNTNLLPGLWSANYGKIKYTMEKVDASNYKASIGITNGTNKGSIELMLKTITPTFDAPFQSAAFIKGSGAAIVGVGGGNLTVSSGKYTFTINNRGAMEWIKYDGATGEKYLWLNAYGRTRTINVGTSVGINENVTTTLIGGFDNGKATGSFRASFGGLSVYIKATTDNLAGGIEFNYSMP